jgi:hypothetical protein
MDFANMQNMGAPRGNMTNPQPGQVNGPTILQIQQAIIKRLGQQQPQGLMGWQQQVNMRVRVAICYNL